jgi:hypothetical protein
MMLLDKRGMKFLVFFVAIFLLTIFVAPLSRSKMVVSAQAGNQPQSALELDHVPVRIDYTRGQAEGFYYTEEVIPPGFETEYSYLPLNFIAAGSLNGTCLSTYALTPVDQGLKLSFACYDFPSSTTDSSENRRWRLYATKNFTELNGTAKDEYLNVCETIAYREFWVGNVLERENVSRSNLWQFPREAVLQEFVNRGFR